MNELISCILITNLHMMRILQIFSIFIRFLAFSETQLFENMDYVSISITL